MLEKVKEWCLDTRALFDEFLREQEQSPNRSYHLSEHKYPSFTQQNLPYQYFDEETNLFLNKTNAGLIYQVLPFTAGNEKLAENLDTILRANITHEFTMQVIFIKHNQVSYDIDNFARQFKSEGLPSLTRLGTYLREFYQEAARHGFKTNDTTKPRLTHTQCFIVIDCIKKGESVLKPKFAQFRVAFEAALRALKIGFKLGDANTFLSLMSLYFNHCPDTTIPYPVEFDKRVLLKDQILKPDFDLEDFRNHLIIRGTSANRKSFETAVSVLTIDKLPDEFQFSNNANNSVNVFYPSQSIPCDHIISVTYKVDEVSRASNKANRKTRSLSKKMGTDYEVQVANAGSQAQTWRTFRNELDSQKVGSVHMLYNLILFSRPSERENDVEAARTTFSYNNIKISSVSRGQMPYFLSSMPFQFTGNLDKDFSLPTMMWHISSWNAVQYMPLISDWAGVGRGILLPTLRDQFALIDPFSDVLGTNYNIAITGTAGSGKSFFIQMMMLNILFNNGDVFIVDVGGSYQKLCEVLGGVYLEYENLAMNPFTYVEDIANDIGFITDLYSLLSCPSGATDDDKGTIRRAILEAFEKTKNDTLVDNVKEALLSLYQLDRESFPSAKIIAKNLEPFCVNAEHGRPFNAKSKLSPDARFIVTDLRAIKDHKSIRAPVLLLILAQYKKRMFDSPRSKQKMCAIDEAWSFFSDDPIASNYVIEGFRTGRKHNASFVTLTQGVQDYYAFDAAKPAWENSSLKFVFLQDHTSLLEHQKVHNTFSSLEMSLLGNFPKAKHAGFSQVLFKTNDISSVHRLFVDPYTLVMLSSAGEDYEAVKNLVESGKSYTDAISDVARAHYGERHA